MRRIWTLCALMLSLTVSVSTAAAVTKGSPSHRPHWIKVTRHGTQAKHRRASRKPGAAGAATAAIAGALAGEDPILLGDQNDESGVDSIGAGRAEAYPFIATTSGSAQSITIYLDSRNRAGSLIAGIYSDSNGQPGTLLVSGTNRSLTSGAWNTVTIASTSVSSGNKYWVTLLGQSGTLYFRDVSSSTCRSAKSAQTSLSALPSNWKTGRTSATCPVSAYVSGTPESSLSSTSGTTSPGLLGPSNTAPPTVSGSTTTGQTLTTSNGSWTNLPTSYAYAWQDCDSSWNNCNAISGATSSSYTLASGDAGHTIRSVVTASNLLGSAAATSDPTSVVVPPAPSNTAPPTVSGTAAQGQILTTGNGSWTNSPTSFKPAWQDCDGSGNNCTTVSGATSSTYTLASGDVGHTIRSIVTAANSGGSTSASSAPTALVARPAPTASFTFSPASPVTGQAVTFDATASSCGAAPCTYTWADDPPGGGSFALGTGQTLSFTFQVVGTKYVTLTMTDAQNRSATVEHDVVVAAPAPSAPTNTAAPAVSGTAQQGRTLSTTTGSWSNSPASYTYAWDNCDTSGNSCVPIGGATSSTYTLGSGDVGHTMRSVVKAANSAGTGTSQSSATSVIAAAPANGPSNTSVPTISGSAQQGQVLTASNGTWSNGPSSYGYAWQDCDTSGSGCTTISGATASTYTLAASDVGDTIRVVVTASNAAGSGSATSQPTAAVTVATPPAGTACDLNATTSNFASQFAALQAGQTLCLASGNYGTWNAGSKSGRVIVKAAAGANVTMTANFNNSANITLDGIATLSQATIQGASHDITVSGSTFPPPGGAITVHPDQMNASSNIVIDRDTFNGQLCDQMSAQGRVAVEAIGNNNGNPLGLTISNNLFEGGTADGIRPDSGSGIQILNNQFISFDNSLNETCHTDAIQLYGSATHILFKGNFFYNSIDMAGCSFSEWNGGDFNTFEDNVVAGTPNNGCYDAIDLHSDNGSTIIHNTFAYGFCEPHNSASSPCGEVGLADSAGHGTVIRDNIVTGFSNGGSAGSASFSDDHNLCHDSGCTGSGDNTGTPTFVGGSAPTTFAGFALAPGSAGVGAASDGTNVGIELPTGG